MNVSAVRLGRMYVYVRLECRSNRRVTTVKDLQASSRARADPAERRRFFGLLTTCPAVFRKSEGLRRT